MLSFLPQTAVRRIPCDSVSSLLSNRNDEMNPVALLPVLPQRKLWIFWAAQSAQRFARPRDLRSMHGRGETGVLFLVSGSAVPEGSLDWVKATRA